MRAAWPAVLCLVAAGLVLACSEPDEDGTTPDTGADPTTDTGTDVSIDYGQPPPATPTLSISPAEPTTVDPLMAVVGLGDGETARIEWYRDGEKTPDTELIIAADSTSKGESWQAVVTAVGTSGESEAAVAEVIIGNAPPTCTSAVITPEDGGVTTEFSCHCAERDDPDPEDEATDSCVWWSEGAEIVITGACELPTEDVPGKGSTLSCVLTPGDGAVTGAEATSADVVISNSPPVGGAVLVEPEACGEADELTCSAGDAIDADGEIPVWSYQWLVNGEPVDETAPVLDGEWFDKGDVVTCRATSADSESSGPTLDALNEAVIVNTTPTLAAASATPPVAGRLQSFTCGHSGWLDPDPADEETVQVEWLLLPDLSVLGTDVVQVAVALSPGDELRCRVTPIDDESQGAPQLSDVVSVINFVPTLKAATLSPIDPTGSATLTCEPSGYLDADNDPAAYAYSWVKNGQTLSAETGPTLAGVFAKGDEIACVITPDDGFDKGAPQTSNLVTIGNAPPTLAGATLTDGPPCGPFECAAVGPADADGDDLEITWRWEIGGQPAPFKTKSTGAVSIQQGHALQCFATVTDGLATVEVGSNLVTPVNTAPSLESVVLTPQSPLLGDLLTCGWAGYSDDCPGDEVKLAWFVDGAVALGQDQPTFDTSGLAGGESVVCSAAPFDGWTSGKALASDAVIVVKPIPKSPIVAVSAPQGADGAVTCDLVQPAGDGEPTIEYAYSWQIGDGPLKPGLQELPATLFSHCDRVKCVVEATVGVLTLTSNTAEIALPNGSDCDDGNLCTTHSCHPAGGCQNDPAPGACDDGDACTTDDACAAGVCAPGKPTDCDDNNPCTDDLCNSAIGCVHNNNAVECDADGSVCTVDDVCAAGVCEAGAPLPCDDGKACTTDACDPLAGCTTTPNPGSCDDGSVCTASDSCNNGDCVGVAVSEKLDCELDEGAGGYCEAGNCNENQAPTPPQVAFEPASPQTGDDLTCVATDAVDSDGWPQAVAYQYSWAVDGEPVGADTATLPGALVKKGTTVTCSVAAFDGMAASSAAVLSVGVTNAPPVVDSVAVVGSDPDVDLTCDFTITDPDEDDELIIDITWMLNGAPVGAQTSATLPADVVEGCDRIACVIDVGDGLVADSATSAPQILEPKGDCGSNPCIDYFCYEQGGCAGKSTPGIPCDDGDFCTLAGVCEGPVCKAPPIAASVCDDGNLCTDDSCESYVGCQNKPVSKPCDADGSVCTHNDACVAGKCEPGAALDCDDGISCTEDLCYATTGCTAPGEEPLPADVPIDVGLYGGPGEFVEVEDGGEIEIVQGPQGGIHTEISVRIFPPKAWFWTPVKLYIDAELRMGCCDGEVASAFFDTVDLAFKVEEGVYMTSSAQLLFYAFNDPEKYAGKKACAHFLVGVYDDNDDITLWTVGRQLFTLVDKIPNG